jgi:hypothetical protein
MFFRQEKNNMLSVAFSGNTHRQHAMICMKILQRRFTRLCRYEEGGIPAVPEGS